MLMKIQVSYKLLKHYIAGTFPFSSSYFSASQVSTSPSSTHSKARNCCSVIFWG